MPMKQQEPGFYGRLAAKVCGERDEALSALFDIKNADPRSTVRGLQMRAAQGIQRIIGSKQVPAPYLFAAAPEMLEVLKLFSVEACHCAHMLRGGTCRSCAARAAIAKAEGR